MVDDCIKQEKMISDRIKQKKMVSDHSKQDKIIQPKRKWLMTASSKGKWSNPTWPATQNRSISNTWSVSESLQTPFWNKYPGWGWTDICFKIFWWWEENWFLAVCAQLSPVKIWFWPCSLFTSCSRSEAPSQILVHLCGLWQGHISSVWLFCDLADCMHKVSWFSFHQIRMIEVFVLAFHLIVSPASTMAKDFSTSAPSRSMWSRPPNLRHIGVSLNLWHYHHQLPALLSTYNIWPGNSWQQIWP